MAATSPTSNPKLNVWRGHVTDFPYRDRRIDLYEMHDDAGWRFSFMREGVDLESIGGLVVIEEERDTNFLEKVQIMVDNDRRYIADLKYRSRCVEIEEESDDCL